ncbi:MAG: hypothetical protein FWE86_00550, partial [Oscillospiraceae bacterium]|nr:hypothetical protein [Oscillospiraceae bacterium]
MMREKLSGAVKKIDALMNTPFDKTWRKIKENFSGYVFMILALSSISALILITAFIIMKGAPMLGQVWGMSWDPENGEFGIFPMIVGTVTVTLGAALIGIPIGVCCSIFLAEF